MVNPIQAVTLEEVLAARDRRAEKQRRIIREYSTPLLSFMVNTPGAYKDTLLSRLVFEEGIAAILRELHQNSLKPIYREINYCPTGAEAYLAVNSDELDLKRITVQIENHHPLGRLFDIDLIKSDLNPASRIEIGESPRKCLLCNENAFACARSQRHSLTELTKKIESLISGYFFQTGE